MTPKQQALFDRMIEVKRAAEDRERWAFQVRWGEFWKCPGCGAPNKGFPTGGRQGGTIHGVTPCCLREAALTRYAPASLPRHNDPLRKKGRLW